jgi:Aldo/keto reductase family
MKHVSLGRLDVSRLGLGTMGMSAFYTGANVDDAESIRTILRALDLGITLIDTAEIYGPFLNEELVGQAIAGRRDQVVLATKFGLISRREGEQRGLDSRPENVRIAVEGSLRRLGTDHIDLYYQHRVDLGTPIEDTVGADGRADRRGQGRAHRPVGGGARDDPPGTCGAPSHRAADRVLAVDAGSRSRDPAPRARARHRLRGLLTTGPRVPDRPDPLDGPARCQRLPS